MRLLIEGPPAAVRAAADEWARYAEGAWGERPDQEVVEPPADSRVDPATVLTLIIKGVGAILALDSLADRVKQRRREAEAEKKLEELREAHPEVSVERLPDEPG